MKDNTTEKVFQYGNIPCVIEVDTDYEEDCVKSTYYLANVETGELVASIPWSPYGGPSNEDMELWIALGAPDEGYTLTPNEETWFVRSYNFTREALVLAASQETDERGKSVQPLWRKK